MTIALPSRAAFALRAAALIPLLATTACIAIGFEPGLDGSGHIVTEDRAVTGFDRVSVENEFDVTVTVGSAYSVRVTGDDNLLPYVKTEVRGATLHLDDERELDPTGDIHIEVTAPSLAALHSSGSSDVRASGIRAEAFSAGVSGSSDMTAGGDFGDLDSSVSGSGSLRLQGTAGDIDASVSGSGDLDLRQVVGRSARVRVSGSGGAVLNVAESLEASVSGSGDVRYVGSPRVESNVSGSGSVRSIGGR